MPTTPGYLGEDQDPARLQAEADEIGYPVLIKAVAGGGGKGMRRVDASAEFADVLLSLQARGGLLVRRRPRADREIYRAPAPYRGAGVRRHARQCRPSVRARLLAAAPPPEGDRGSAGAGHGRGDARGGLRRGGEGGEGGRLCRRGDDRVHRRRLRGAARRPHLVHGNEHAAPGRASGDRGDHRRRSGRMAAAGGERASRCRSGRTSCSINGWAMEARLYAEDPANEFLPSHRAGSTISSWPKLDCEHPESIRGVEEEATGQPFYDPMIAKLIARGRRRATRRSTACRRARRQVEVWPVQDQCRLPRARCSPSASFERAMSTPASSRRGSTARARPAPPTASGSLARRTAVLARSDGNGAPRSVDCRCGLPRQCRADLRSTLRTAARRGIGRSVG